MANANYETQRQAERRRPWRVHHVANGSFWIVRNRETGEIALRAASRARAFRCRDRLNASLEPPRPANQLIDTKAVIRHCVWLKTVGVGLRTVSVRSGVSRGVLCRILSGDIRKTRRGTADKILAIGPSDRPGAAFIDAAETWRLLEDLIALGYRRGWIAQQLGARRPALQLRRDRITVTTARKVRRLYLEISRRDARLQKRFGNKVAGEQSTRERVATTLRSMPMDEIARGLARLLQTK
ncbi:hypothetical protein EPN44_01390 [bacterium]|nr:MAG: hypothetical protein EPN44_01390 [bacterium]